MSEAKWPAGPWDFMWVSAPASGGGHLYITDATGRKIAAIWGKAEEKEFAASLIAAAPELYEALQQMTALFGPLQRKEYVGGGAGFKLVIDAVKLAEVALAKARGGP